MNEKHFEDKKEEKHVIMHDQPTFHTAFVNLLFTSVNTAFIVQHKHHRLIVKLYLQDIPPISTFIVASPKNINTSVYSSRAVPCSLHWSLCARCPVIGCRVKTVCLPEVCHPSAPACYINFPIHHCPSMAINLEGKLE